MADLQALIYELQMQQVVNYLAAAGGALVLYDQVLTFSQEVDLIWNRQWSYMTALYFIARYSGDLLVIGYAAMYMCINWTYSGFVSIYLAVNWANNIFLLTMQAILVIRVYALFNRSKKVLIFLATFYVLQAIATIAITGLIANKRVLDKSFTYAGPALGSVVQGFVTNFPTFLLTAERDNSILSVVFDSILLCFALWAFGKHALEAKTLNKGWSINVLVRTVVADHLLYFVCNLIWLSLALATTNAGDSYTILGILVNDLSILSATLVVVAGPRMVISLRTIENKTRGEGETLEGEMSTIRFGVREPPAQSESVMEEGGGF
ncbi:hypothetical protein BJ138DRAFT_1167787 [Hygrophoropsis aurantiaca]|uniref:Uncharacterized protein n=1 Tax=Hygrophoropsis aurantiaca TaxID=72124 RepID=A0ACB7ZSD7_9AGAM|nr:hypothetical protein BJ138DRAFT_1167787 [Hygrophoropsis aurantiaca]